MKKRKNITQYILGTLALFVGLTAGQAFATPGDTVSPLIHKGAGAQIVVDMVLGASTPTSALIDVNQSGTNSVFDGIDEGGLANLDGQSFMTVLGNSWLQDQVFIGKNRDAEFVYSIGATFPDPLLPSIPVNTKAGTTMELWTNSYTAGTPTLQKMNVFGGILSTDMNAAAGNATGDAQICVDSVGKIVMCP